jgi:hypothetical protein
MSANLERLRHRLGGSENIGEIKRIREQASHLAGGAGIEIEELCEAQIGKVGPEADRPAAKFFGQHVSAGEDDYFKVAS